jgi:hypothetical protein
MSQAGGPALAATRDATALALTGDRVWQKGMLPLMVRLVLALTVFFFAVSLIQLTYLHWTIKEVPALDLSPALANFQNNPPTTFDQRIKLAELQMLAALDAGTMEHRYHQVTAALMARVWKGYMGFVTGMIMAMVGALFILGKMQDTTVSLSPDGDGAVSIKSTSPGLIMGALGVLLMATTIVVNHRIDVVDAPGNIRYYQAASSPDELPSVPPPPDDTSARPPDTR